MILQASIYIIFAALLIVSALLLLVVLMQRPKQEGLGAAFGSQMTDQAFGAQTTDVLKKGTVLFGTLFMLLSFVLAVLMNAQYKRAHSTGLSTGEEQVKQEAPATPATPAAPATPDAPTPEQQTTVPSTAPEAPAEAP